MTSSVMSIWALVTAYFIGSAMKSFSAPKASEWSMIFTRPASPRSSRMRAISVATSARRSSSAALTLKNRASRPSALMSSFTRSAFLRVALRSRCTPKMSQPARARARAVAAPKPDDAPRIRAQPVSLIGEASALIRVSFGASFYHPCYVGGGAPCYHHRVYGADGGHRPHRQRDSLRQDRRRQRFLPLPRAPRPRGGGAQDRRHPRRGRADRRRGGGAGATVRPRVHVGRRRAHARRRHDGGRGPRARRLALS